MPLSPIIPPTWIVPVEDVFMLLTLILVEHLDIGLTDKPLLYHPQIPPILDEVDIYCKLIYPFVTWQLVIKPD